MVLNAYNSEQNDRHKINLNRGILTWLFQTYIRVFKWRGWSSRMLWLFKIHDTNLFTCWLFFTTSFIKHASPERFYLSGNYMFKVNNRNIRARCEICSKLTIKTAERRQWRRSGVSILNFEHISHLVLVFLLLNLSR